jgi:hypothetical protein
MINLPLGQLIRFRFSNGDYAQLFSSHNQEPIRSKLVEVEP